MVAVFRNVPWPRVLAAAARLALIYATGVLLLFGVLVAFTVDVRDITSSVHRVLGPAAVSFGIVFAVAFLLLAVARRAGFAALWLLLGAFWTWIFFAVPLRPSWAAGPFLSWSLMAMPLFVIGALGTAAPRREPPRRWRPSADGVVFVAWLALTIAAGLSRNSHHVYQLDAPLGMLGAAMGIVWMCTPFLIAGFALARMWIATGRVLAARETI